MKSLMWALIIAGNLMFIDAKPIRAEISHDEMEQMFQDFHQLYDSELPNLEQIVFNPPMLGGLHWWDLDTYHAAYEQIDNFRYIYIHGGVPRASFLDKEGVALIICHEMGHGFGGGPFKKMGGNMEGQADYYSTKTCLNKYFQLYPESIDEKKFSSEYIELCKSHESVFPDRKLCLRGLRVIAERIEEFKMIKKVQTSLFTPDTSVADHLEKGERFYPEPQCRLDTLLAGWFQMGRPACWYPPNGDHLH